MLCGCTYQPRSTHETALLSSKCHAAGCTPTIRNSARTVLLQSEHTTTQETARQVYFRKKSLLTKPGLPHKPLNVTTDTLRSSHDARAAQFPAELQETDGTHTLRSHSSCRSPRPCWFHIDGSLPYSPEKLREDARFAIKLKSNQRD